MKIKIAHTDDDCLMVVNIWRETSRFFFHEFFINFFLSTPNEKKCNKKRIRNMINTNWPLRITSLQAFIKQKKLLLTKNNKNLEISTFNNNNNTNMIINLINSSLLDLLIYLIYTYMICFFIFIFWLFFSLSILSIEEGTVRVGALGGGSLCRIYVDREKRIYTVYNIYLLKSFNRNYDFQTLSIRFRLAIMIIMRKKTYTLIKLGRRKKHKQQDALNI